MRWRTERGKNDGGEKSCWLRRKQHHLPLKHQLRHDSGSALGPINRYLNTNLQRNILWEKLIHQDWLCGLIIRPELKLAVNLTELPRGTQTILMSVQEWNSLNSLLRQTRAEKANEPRTLWMIGREEWKPLNIWQPSVTPHVHCGSEITCFIFNPWLFIYPVFMEKTFFNPRHFSLQ